MRIPSNKIADIVSFFRKELKDVYEGEEMENIIWLSFNHVLGLSKTSLQLSYGSNVNQSDLLKLYFISKDLKKNKPIQYILGETEFCGLKLKVNDSVLIPRPETEELVHLVKNEVISIGKKNLKIIDIGTGSGCIAVSLKKFIPEAEVHALDVSEKALKVARENALLNNAEIIFHESDILNQKTFGQTFDIIISNPPYVTLQEKPTLDKRVVNHEPHLALFAGENDPLIFYKAILDFAHLVKNKNVTVYFEMNDAYAEEVKSLAGSKHFSADIIEDMFGKRRFLRAVK